MQRIVFIALLMAGLQLLNGCGGSSANSGTHAFVANSSGGTIDTYNIQGDGSLVSSSSISATGAACIQLVPAGSGAASTVVDFAYVVGQNQNTISIYNVDKNGVFTASSSSATDNNFPTNLVVDSGYLYAADSGTQGSPGISAYSINTTTGALTFVGSTTLSFAPQFLVASGGFLYAAIPTAGIVEAFTINTSSGTVTPLASALGPIVNAGTRPTSLTLAGGYLLATDSLGNAIYIFQIQSGQGNLLSVAGSPFTVNSGPSSIAVDSASHIYVASKNANTVSIYSISSTGQLSQLTGSPYTTKGQGAAFLSFSPTANALYVANSTTSNLDEFQVSDLNNNLTLTAFSSSPIGAGAGPAWIAVK